MTVAFEDGGADNLGRVLSPLGWEAHGAAEQLLKLSLVLARYRMGGG